MRKLQQFYVCKFTSGCLKNSDFTIDRTFKDLKKKKEIVSLADSQVLRTLRMIKHERNQTSEKEVYSSQNLSDLLFSKKFLKKKIEKSNVNDKVYVKNLKNELFLTIEKINNMLFVPEYILIVIENVSDYKNMIRKGLYINGQKYVRLLCSAGMARNNTVAFVKESYKEDLIKYLKNGLNPETKITKHKYNAYFALTSTATHTVSKPNVLLVDDCEIEMEKQLDWVTEAETKGTYYNKERIIKSNKKLSFNLFDGAGLVDIKKATEWAEELELDYIPSVFIIRSNFIKGCLFTVDFQKFNREVSQKEKIVDLYGIGQEIENKNVILTKSQFKLWNGFESIEDYQEKMDKNFNYWGIARVSPKEDDYFFTTNYQFLQVLDLKEEDVENICEPTISWIKKVSGLDRNYALMFLLGSLCLREDINPQDIFYMTGDNVAKALIINKKLIEDEYIRQTILHSINKKIKEAYIGKLILRGNFSTMIPDLYAMMEWSFGMEVKGLLKEGEHYSSYWNNRDVVDAVGLRSPLTWRSEVNKLSFIKNEKTEEWYQYCNSGIIFNVWGCDCIIAADKSNCLPI